MEEAKQEEAKEPIKAVVLIVEDENGNKALEVQGEKQLSMAQLRALLEWALNKTNDEIHAIVAERTVDAMLKQKLTQKGFRPSNIKDFLLGK